MTYGDFLNAVIDEGIEAAKADYDKPEDKYRLDGSIEGFEACRGKTPAELWDLLNDARKKTLNAHREQAADYWRIRSYEGEIEWVCNVMSAAMANIGMEPIVPITAHGAMKAARILAGGSLLIVGETPA